MASSPAPHGGAPPVSAPNLFGEYELLEQVANTGSGITYRARHRLMGRTYLLKMLPPAVKDNPEIVLRFQREIRLAAQLHHPQLVPAVYAGCEHGAHYLVLEEVSGTDLGAHVSRHGPLDVPTAVDYVRQAAEVLDYVHQQGVVHRNIKPQNLLLDSFGRIRLVNFTAAGVETNDPQGLAGGNQLTRQGRFLGTHDYAAPEQSFDAHSADQRSDIYSLGCTLHFLLLGQPPYQAQGKEKLTAHMKQPIPSLRARRADVPESLDAVFQRMLAKMPTDRFGSMQDVVAALNGILPSSSAHPHTRGPTITKWHIAAVFLGGAVLGACLGMALRSLI